MSRAVRPRPSSALALLLTVAGAVLALALGGAPHAGAHGDEGTMTVTAAEQVATDRVRVEVGIVYTNDDDPAEEAAVTATLTAPDGQVVGPVDLPAISGAVYGAEIDVPGPATWQVAVASTTPTAAAEASVEVVAATPETTDAPPSTNAETGVLVEPEPSLDADEAAADADDESSDNGAAIVIAGAVGLAVIAAIAVVLVLRRRAAT
jgi:hypothetical protein